MEKKIPQLNVFEIQHVLRNSMAWHLYLLQFITVGMEWAHLDITGPAWNRQIGTATGYPVRTIVKWIMGLSQ